MTEHCQYIQHENGIHEIILLTAIKDTVDCYYEIVERLFLNKPDHETLRYILNATQCDLPPLRYFVQQSLAYEKKYPHLGPGRLVVLHPRNAFWWVVSSTVNVVNLVQKGTLEVHLFGEMQREQAIEWLLQDD